MPRYFFVLYGPEDQIHNDPIGTELADKAHAVDHAKRIVRELKEGGGYNGSRWALVVTDPDGEEIASLSFNDTQQLH
jgi:hypothetical protein